jgi:hypothetical protein
MDAHCMPTHTGWITHFFRGDLIKPIQVGPVGRMKCILWLGYYAYHCSTRTQRYCR